MATESVTTESFLRMLGELSPREQEAVLFEAAAHAHYLRDLEKLKTRKITPGKFAVAVLDRRSMGGWQLEEHDDLQQAAASRKALMATESKVEALIVNDAGDFLDEAGNVINPSFYE